VSLGRIENTFFQRESEELAEKSTHSRQNNTRQKKDKTKIYTRETRHETRLNKQDKTKQDKDKARAGKTKTRPRQKQGKDKDTRQRPRNKTKNKDQQQRQR
jgi:hypothetical protein